MRLNIKEVLAAPSRNMEAQTDEIMCWDLGFPKGQLRVTEGVCGHGLPARALQALDSHRGSIKPEVPEVLSWHATDDILLPCCRNTEGPPSWNPSDPNVTRPPHSFRGVGGGLHSFTGGCVVSCGEQSFLLLAPPCREPKGPCSKHCCTTNSGVCSAECTA